MTDSQPNWKNQMWLAVFFTRIQVLGLFDDLDDAIEATKKAEEFYFLPVIKKYSK